MSLTASLIRAAKEGDPEAVAGVLRAVERLVRARAVRTDRDTAEDLAQIGREAAWLSIRRFAGTEPAQFVAYVDRTITGAMSDARKEYQRQGVSRAIAANFERAVRLAGGDPYLAQELATSAEVMGAKRMSPGMAYAARVSYQGAVYDVERLAQPPGPVQAGSLSARRARRLLAKLGAQQRRVLERTYGIGDVCCASDSEIAAELGIPTARVSSIRARAHARCRELARWWM